VKNTFPCVEVGKSVYGVVTSNEDHALAAFGGLAAGAAFPDGVRTRSAGFAARIRAGVQ
jgi:hypothetical protein